MTIDTFVPRAVDPRASARRLRIRHGDWQLLPFALAVTDASTASFAVVVAGVVRLRLDEFAPVVSLGLADRHLVASLLVVPVLLMLFRMRGLYERDRVLAGSREYAEIASAATYGVLFTLAISFFLGDGPVVSRSWLLLVWAFSLLSVVLGRFIARRVVRRLRLYGRFRTRVVIVGASSFGIALAEQFQAAQQEGVDVVGFLDEYIPLGQPLLNGTTVIGRPADLTRLRRADVDEYILIPQALPHERLEEITSLMVSRGEPRLRMAVSSGQLLTHGVHVAERANVPLVTLGRARIAGIDAVLKRVLDITGAGIALVVIGPVAGVAAVRALARRSHGLLYSLDIHGACGERVTLWLFGRALSEWLPVRGVPALIAVLQGRASLVGPRPVLLDDQVGRPVELGLTAMKPGLTGPWRLSGPGATLAEQAVRDLAYVRGYSIWEDLRLLWETCRALGSNCNTESALTRWQEPIGCSPVTAAPFARLAREA